MERSIRLTNYKSAGNGLFEWSNEFISDRRRFAILMHAGFISGF